MIQTALKYLKMSGWKGIIERFNSQFSYFGWSSRWMLAWTLTHTPSCPPTGCRLFSAALLFPGLSEGIGGAENWGTISLVLLESLCSGHVTFDPQGKAWTLKVDSLSWQKTFPHIQLELIRESHLVRVSRLSLTQGNVCCSKCFRHKLLG